MNTMFMRETEGVYSFGTGRVNVRVDKDRINSKFLFCWDFTFRFKIAPLDDRNEGSTEKAKRIGS